MLKIFVPGAEGGKVIFLSRVPRFVINVIHELLLYADLICPIIWASLISVDVKSLICFVHELPGTQNVPLPT